MNRRQIALKLVLDELGISAEMDSFDQRLILQKAVYLAQQAGVPLGYHYYWYLRGPYSRDLTGDAYSSLGESPKGWALDEPLKKKLVDLKQFFSELRNKENPVKEFELLASVLFSICTGQASAKEPQQITTLMKLAGKNFSMEDVNGAIETLNNQGFLKAA